MSSCSYIFLKSEFDRLKQNDPDFQKLLAIYEPGRPKNKSEYGFMMDMLTLQSATKNDKMMRKKSRIAAQYNGTYTKNESIYDRLAGVEDLIDTMEKAGCGYGLGAYAAQQKLKQQPTSNTIKQPTLIDCVFQALNLLSYKNMCHYQISNFSVSTLPLCGSEIKLNLLLDECRWTRLELVIPSQLIESTRLDKDANIDANRITNTDAIILRIAFILFKIYQRLIGKDLNYIPPVNLEVTSSPDF